MALGVGLPAGALAAPPATPTQEQISKATALYDAGVDLRDNGDLKGAVAKLKEAFALVPSPVIGLALAVTHDRMRELIEAREVLRKVAALPVLAAEGPASAQARKGATELAGKLDARIPKVRVAVTGATGGDAAVVQLDGATAVAGAEVAVNPGKHTVVASHPGQADVRRDVDVVEGATADVALAFAAAPAAPVSEKPQAAPSRGVLWAGLAITGAGVVVGAATGAVALSKASEVKSHCPMTHCPAEASAIDTSKLMGNVSTAGFVVAGAGAIVTIVGGVIAARKPAAKDAQVTPWVGLGTAGLAGRY
jgi:hypothetical protein